MGGAQVLIQAIKAHQGGLVEGNKPKQAKTGQPGHFPAAKSVRKHDTAHIVGINFLRGWQPPTSSRNGYDCLVTIRIAGS